MSNTLSDEILFELIKEHFGLDKRPFDTVIDRKTGKFHDAARYRDFAAAVLAKLGAVQQEAQEPMAIPEAIERMASDRYKVVPSHESMFYRWAVIAGTGTRQLYLGREVECQNMARKFAGAFLDGAFVAMQQAAPQPAPAPANPDGDELRKIARTARTSASDDASPTEYVLAGWRAALAAQKGTK